MRRGLDFRISDLRAIKAVVSAGSLSGAARELKTTTPNISKALARVESELGVRLLHRTARRISLTVEGEAIVPELADVCARLEGLGRTSPEMPRITLGAMFFLLDFFLPAIAEKSPDLRFRGLDLAPQLIGAIAAEKLLDCVITLGSPGLPSTWIGESVGRIEKRVFCAPSVAKRLGGGVVTEKAIAECEFISPVYFVRGQVVPVNDDCPMSPRLRKVGHQTTTLRTACELAARTNLLVFSPRLSAAPWVEAGRLVEVDVEGWAVSEELSFFCNSDRMKRSDAKRIATTVRESLAEFSRRSG